MRKNGKKHRALVVALLIALSVALTLQVFLNQSLSTTAAPTDNRASFDYVVVIWMENKNYADVIGSSSSPYLTSLASQYGLATNYRNSADTGSLPNYIAPTTGQTPAWSACNTPPSTCTGFVPISSSIVDSLDAKALSWKAYMEAMPSPCYSTNSEYYSNGNGVYYPRHNPFIYLSRVINNPADCNRIVPAGNSDSSQGSSAQLLIDLRSPSTASNFMWLTPNGCNDSHDCSAAQADSYLSGLVPQILSSTVFKTQNAALFITWDEGSTDSHVAAIWAGSAVKNGFQSSIPYSHYSFLKTIETNWDLPMLTLNDAAAAPMTEFFNTDSSPQSKISTVPEALSGWGGIRLEEAGQLCPVSGAPNSSVFPGECASSMEMQILKLRSLGYNVIRADFVNQCNSPQPEMGPYSATNLDRAIKLARYYSFWIIVDWHGYHDLEPTYLSCWLSQWKGIIQQFTGSYTQLIWEPENEPMGGTNPTGSFITLPQLSSAYQQWIDQARALGDTHYISVPSLCINTCPNWFASLPTSWPAVHDTIGHVLINIHTYMYYPYWSQFGWNNATADRAANTWYQAITAGMATTGYRALVTEGGADWISGSPSDIVIGTGGGDVQYTKTSLHFVQKIVDLFDHNNPRISWVLWPVGLWTQCCKGGGLHGALESGGYGLQVRPTPMLKSAIIAYSSAPSIGDKVSFIGSVIGGISPYNYTWNFGDGSIGTGVSPTHNYALAGNYSFRLTVTDSTNITSTSNGFLTVSAPANVTVSKPILVVPNPKITRPGTPVRFTVMASTRSPRMIILSAVGLPQGANFTSTPGNPVYGNFSWTPSDAGETGDHIVTFTAQESGSLTFDIKSVTIQVVATVQGPVLLWPWMLPLFTLSAVAVGLVSYSGFTVMQAYRIRPRLRRPTSHHSFLHIADLWGFYSRYPDTSGQTPSKKSSATLSWETKTTDPMKGLKTTASKVLLKQHTTKKITQRRVMVQDHGSDTPTYRLRPRSS